VGIFIQSAPGRSHGGFVIRGNDLAQKEILPFYTAPAFRIIPGDCQKGILSHKTWRIFTPPDDNVAFCSGIPYSATFLSAQIPPMCKPVFHGTALIVSVEARGSLFPAIFFTQRVNAISPIKVHAANLPVPDNSPPPFRSSQCLPYLRLALMSISRTPQAHVSLGIPTFCEVPNRHMGGSARCRDGSDPPPTNLLGRGGACLFSSRGTPPPPLSPTGMKGDPPRGYPRWHPPPVFRAGFHVG
jgi:hypothetical protein